KPPGYNYTRVLVVPKTKYESVEWIEEELPDLPTAVYTVDDVFAKLTVPMNKGHEAMVYLTYIIDHYDKLPDTVLFFHAEQFAWHNNPLLNDGDSAEAIRRLSDDRVARMGYMNTRCHHDPGCPDWIHLDRPDVDLEEKKKAGEEDFTIKVWRELFPGERAPPSLAQPCCAQFAVSRDRIRETPREKYVFWRLWLMNTELDDHSSGRVFEYLWQYIFTRNYQYCPAVHTCYCDGFGICFGSSKAFDAFWSKVQEKEWLKGETERIDSHDLEGEPNRLGNMMHQVTKLEKDIDVELRQAYERGGDPFNRLIEAEKYE
ncbi:hypothetical protein K490DRAFT_18729, partial [Saccharata proteae CBS 121410]